MARRADRAQYFARHAEPESAFASLIDGKYSAALVVPACRESLALLDGYREALIRSPGRVLLVLVVNGADDASALTHSENQRLLSELALRFADRIPLRAPGLHTEAWLARTQHCDLLWLDRASSGARLAAGQGVGLARKLGADLCACLYSRGQVACAQIACSDADATLPADYFARLVSAALEAPDASALLWPFRHEAGGARAIDLATSLYEVSLRYYVLGLSAARSPYAYHSLGSSLSFDACAYVGVRGFPKRAAAEDFYLLDKLAKTGPLQRLPGAPIRLTARASDRVPFGTGRRTADIAEQSARGLGFELYSPELFRALGVVIDGLNAFADSGQPCALRGMVEARAEQLAGPTLAALAGLKVFEALSVAAGQAPVGAVLRRRVHTWFNAFRTLRFMHTLRALRLPSVPWREALCAAPFLADPFRDGPSPEAVCARLTVIEAELPALVGPTL